MNKILVIFLGLSVSLVSLFCDNSITESKTNSIAKKNLISECGGFQPNENLAKRMVDTSEYCKAERLNWQYAEETKTLSIEIRRLIGNCAAKYSLTATMENETLLISLEDTCKNLDANCMCPFDASCEIQDIAAENINVMYKQKNFSLSLNEIRGEFLVDTSITMCP